MGNEILSVFIDESGDFGEYDTKTPYYIVTMVMHNQDVDINSRINELTEHIFQLGYDDHAIHTGPLIRRESIYINDEIEKRRALFNSLFHFTRKLDINYICAIIKKSECADNIQLTMKISKEISNALKRNEAFYRGYKRIIIYYDNGQVELTKIITSVFSTLFSDVEFRRVQPVEYKLFQVADLICTLELVFKKAQNNSFSNSEILFFGSTREFNKNIYKYIEKKKL